MFEIVVAFCLDLFLGDPLYAWHPVRVIGRLIKGTEARLRRRVGGGRFSGLLLVFFVTTASFVMVWFLRELAGQVHPFLKKLVSIFFIYSALSVKDLQREARGIYTALIHDKLEKARENLARIVGRETKDLDEAEIIRATVEAVAESFVDGVLSPLFYTAIGGAPLAIAYKAVNTLDSMVGLRTPPYREFGFVAAKLDELANWIPARISWLLIGIGSFFTDGRGLEAWRVGFEDGVSRSHSNSAVPEAAFAGALGVELGGTNYYEGQKVETPKLGYPMRALGKDDIRQAYRLMKASAWASLIFAMALSYLVWFLSIKIVDPAAL